MRQVDERGVDVTERIVRQPAVIEWHAALVQRERAGTVVDDSRTVGAAETHAAVGREGAVGGSVPLGIEDEAVLARRRRRVGALRLDVAQDAVDAQRTEQAGVAVDEFTGRDIRGERAAGDVVVLVGRRRGRRRRGRERALGVQRPAQRRDQPPTAPRRCEAHCASRPLLHSKRSFSSVLWSSHSSLPCTVTGKTSCGWSLPGREGERYTGRTSPGKIGSVEGTKSYFTPLASVPVRKPPMRVCASPLLCTRRVGSRWPLSRTTFGPKTSTTALAAPMRT